MNFYLPQAVRALHRTWPTPSRMARPLNGVALALLALAGTAAQAASISFYLSPPRVQFSEISPNITETFDALPTGAQPRTGTWAIGTYAPADGSPTATQASVNNADAFGGANGSRYLSPKNPGLSITLNEPARYIGFWWSAGDANNFLELYDKDGNKLFEFSTAMLTTLLKNDATTKVIANNGTEHLTRLYYGNPSRPPPSNAGEAYAYVHMALSGSESAPIERLVVRGSNFELDNITLAGKLNGSPPEPEPEWITVGSSALASDPPAAQGDSNATVSETPVSGNVRDNDYQPDGSTVTSTVVTPVPPGEGTLVFNPDGTYDFTPAPGFSGTTGFTYRTCTSAAPPLCSTATVEFTVLSPPQNDAITVLNNGMPATRDVSGNDGSIVPGSTFSLTSQPANGTATMDPLTGQVTYLPNPGFEGNDPFGYQVCLPAPQDTTCAPATVTMTVLSTPGTQNDALTVLNNGTPATRDVSGNDGSIAPGSTFSLTSQPANGTATMDPVTGQITYQPNPGFEGEDPFGYQVCLPAPLATTCTPATVTITVPSTVGAAVTTPPSVPGDGGGSVSLPPPALPPGSSHTVISVDPPVGTTRIDTSTGEVTFTPDQTVGDVTITVGHCLPAPNDSNCLTVTHVVTVTAEPVPAVQPVPGLGLWSQLFAALAMLGLVARRRRSA